MNINTPLLKKIDQYLNAVPRPNCDVVEVPPFTIFFRRDSEMTEITYARPTSPLVGELTKAFTEVKAEFAKRKRTCRWEFIEDLFPTLPALLLKHGFAEPITRPLLAVTRDTFICESNSDIEIIKIGKAEASVVDKVVGASFGDEDVDPNEPIDMESGYLLGMIDRGCSAYAAKIDGRIVGGGVHSPVDDTTELAGIGVLPAYRRRGVAGALSAALVADAFERGCECVFLSAADEAVQRVYARIGFVRIGVAMDSTELVEGWA